MSRDGKKTGGRNFVKGQVGNPLGRPSLPEDVRRARKFNVTECTRVISKFFNMTLEEVEVISKTPETPMLERTLAKLFVEAEKTGDQSKLEFLFNRSIGKVTDKLNVKLPKPTVIKLIGEDAILVVGAQGDDDEGEV